MNHLVERNLCKSCDGHFQSSSNVHHVSCIVWPMGPVLTMKLVSNHLNRAVLQYLLLYRHLVENHRSLHGTSPGDRSILP